MRRETSELDFVEIPFKRLFTQVFALQQLDLTRDKFTEVAKRAKSLYGAIPAHALKEPAECSRRAKVIRALTIQIVILEILSVSGYRDLEWIRNALLATKVELNELEKGFTSQLLQPRKRSPAAGREPHHQRVVKDTSGMAYEALCRLGIKKKKAAEMVADCITERGFLPARHRNQKSVSYRSIINWAERETDGSVNPLVFIHFLMYGSGSRKQIIADLEEILEAHRRGVTPNLGILNTI
jgi:hypothetical protein